MYASELCAGYLVEEYDDLDTEEVVLDAYPHRWTRETLRRQPQYLTHEVLTTEAPLTNDERRAIWREKRDILRDEIWAYLSGGEELPALIRPQAE